MDATVSFDEYLKEWSTDVRAGNPSTIELGRRFARKLLTQWLELDEHSDEIFYCDGSGDGGVDIAYLDHVEASDEIEAGSDTWYLIQSKYGKAFQGDATLLKEGKKLIETLDNPRKRVSSLTQEIIERLTQFQKRASDRDRIVLVFATNEPLTSAQSDTLKDIRAMGRARLGPKFDVESVSVDTIYQRALEGAVPASRAITVPLVAAHLPKEVLPVDNLLVFTVSLTNLYKFLESYQEKTCDINQLYEKNLRRYLGVRGKVNRAIRETLTDAPERFGLYNNGITIVVTDFRLGGNSTLRLTNPFIVNGCQTTRTIWDVFRQRLRAGGTGVDAEMQDWQKRADQGIVVAKIVRIGHDDEDMLRKITRYTNSQNAVREKDFTALEDDFQAWKRDMETKYHVFLEIQRGAWDSQRAWQKQHPGEVAFEKYANAFDLLKVYGAGWLGEAGNAFGRNAAFLPSGAVFRTIVSSTDSPQAYGADDLYAAYQLYQAADQYEFGRSGRGTRRLTRYLFYLVAVELLKTTMVRSHLPALPYDITRAINKLFQSGEQSLLLDAAIEAIDEYMTEGTPNSVFDEPILKEINGNLNRYLKSEQIGDPEKSPVFKRLIGDFGRQLGRPPEKGKPSPRDKIVEIIST